MGTPETVAIVGAGLAGAKTAEALRDEGFNGHITLVGEEVARPFRVRKSRDHEENRHRHQQRRRHRQTKRRLTAGPA